MKGKNPYTGRFEKGTENPPPPEGDPTLIHEMPEEGSSPEATEYIPPKPQILWEKGDIDREGRVWSWRAPFREMRIVINRTKETRDPNAPNTEWLLLRFGAILSRGASAAELMRYADENNL
jgi:hypothetical protein